MSRRANGEGTVTLRADGRYMARLSYVDPITGKRERATFYAGTAKAVRAKLKDARDRLEAQAPPKDATRTVAAWLAHWRATVLAASDRKPATLALYATLCRKHLEPSPFGALRLDRLRPSDITGLVLALRSKTKPGKPTDAEPNPAPVRALSDSTIRTTYTVLRAALDSACTDGLLARNPAAQVARPGVKRREAVHLGPRRGGGGSAGR